MKLNDELLAGLQCDQLVEVARKQSAERTITLAEDAVAGVVSKQLAGALVGEQQTFSGKKGLGYQLADRLVEIDTQEGVVDEIIEDQAGWELAAALLQEEYVRTLAIWIAKRHVNPLSAGRIHRGSAHRFVSGVAGEQSCFLLAQDLIASDLNLVFLEAAVDFAHRYSTSTMSAEAAIHLANSHAAQDLALAMPTTGRWKALCAAIAASDFPDLLAADDAVRQRVSNLSRSARNRPDLAEQCHVEGLTPDESAMLLALSTASIALGLTIVAGLSYVTVEAVLVAAIASEPPHFLRDPQLPASLRTTACDGGVIRTSDDEPELLEIEWQAGEELEIQIGKADAYIRIKIGDHEPNRLSLTAADSNQVGIGGGVGYGGKRTFAGVYPFSRGDSGHLRFFEILPANSNGSFSLNLDPSDRFLATATYFRVISGHVTIEETLQLGSTETPRHVFRGDCTVILRDGGLRVPAGTGDFPRLVVEGRNQMVASFLDGCTARRVDVRPLANFAVLEGQHINDAELLPRSALTLEPGASVGSIVGHGGRIDGVFDEQGEPKAGQPFIVVTNPDEDDGPPARVRTISNVSIRMEEGTDAGAVLEVSGRMNAVFVDHPITTRKDHAATIRLTSTAMADGIVFRTGRLIDDHEGHPDPEECHRHVKLALRPQSVLTNGSGSVSIAEVAGATLHGNPKDGLEICSIADGVDFEGSSIVGAILPLDETFAASIALKARSSLQFDVHPSTWSHTSEIFNSCRGSGPEAGRWRRAGFAARSVGRPDRSSSDRFRSALHATEQLSRTKGGQLMSRAGLRYALLASRQTTSDWASERLLLVVGRSLGFGLRILRPLGVWLALSAVLAAVIAQRSGIPADFSIDGLGRYVKRVLDAAIEPSSLIRGASSDGALEKAQFSEAARFAARVVLALPFGSAVLAILRRTTWTQD